ncbi:MAG: 16S rRNA (cytosine(1402)-N(4))-methyltransferase RsmH [Planctomycetes bacterium]|nr:16S rRNA (cytosine(1402)-N(4))-methyltransferase RsmH [Planctomycetota bacterium]
MSVLDDVPAPRHVSVMPREVLDLLAPQPGQIIVDATVGAGGHARLLAQRVAPSGRVIGLDCDLAMLRFAKSRLASLPVSLIHGSFDDLPSVLEELHLSQVDGIVADLGFCTDQMDDSKRGLSFQKEGPLDMRLDQASGEPAWKLVDSMAERDLADLFWKYGEERFSRRVARRIVAERKRHPLRTTTELAELVRGCVPRPRGRHGIDPATRVFQALRIAVNDELGALERFLAILPGCLKPGSRGAVISFHSLEDRLVKQAFRDRATYQPLTKKPVQASADEVRDNPRARSAKLRAVMKL